MNLTSSSFHGNFGNKHLAVGTLPRCLEPFPAPPCPVALQTPAVFQPPLWFGGGTRCPPSPWLRPQLPLHPPGLLRLRSSPGHPLLGAQLPGDASSPQCLSPSRLFWGDRGGVVPHPPKMMSPSEFSFLSCPYRVPAHAGGVTAQGALGVNGVLSSGGGQAPLAGTGRRFCKKQNKTETKNLEK